jgi:hypothetical protein
MRYIYRTDAPTVATTTSDFDDVFEQIRLEFIEEQEKGKHPTLDIFVARYPEYAERLTEFVVDYLNVQNALCRNEVDSSNTVREQPKPYVIRGWERAMSELDIPDEEPAG